MKKCFLICKSIYILKVYLIRYTYVKKFLSDKINGTKNALFFLSRAPTRHNFTFNLPFLNNLRDEVRLSKTVCGIFHLRLRFIFIKVYTFVQQNAWTLWLKTKLK